MNKLLIFDKCQHPVRIHTANGVEFFPCGRCSCCINNKASRNEQLIKDYFNLTQFTHHAYFLTLTYDNDHVPFVTVGRHTSEERFFIKVSDKFNYNPKRSPHFVMVQKYPCSSGDWSKICQRTNKISSWRRRANVLCRKDLQDFFKQLKNNLKKNNYETEFTYFVCGEYGPKNLRPHYHIILFSKSCIGRYLQQNLYKIWKNGFVSVKHTTSSTSSYIAQYLNSTCTLPPHLQVKHYKPFFVHSIGVAFPVSSDMEEEKNLLREAYFTNDYSRFIDRIISTGNASYSIPYDKSYISKLFPKCRGFSLSDRQKNRRSYLFGLTFFKQYESECCREVADIIQLISDDCRGDYGNYQQVINNLYLTKKFIRNAIRFFPDPSIYRSFNLYLDCIMSFYNFVEQKKLKDWYNSTAIFMHPDFKEVPQDDKAYYLLNTYKNGVPDLRKYFHISEYDFEDSQIALYDSFGFDLYSVLDFNQSLPEYVCNYYAKQNNIVEHKEKHKYFKDDIEIYKHPDTHKILQNLTYNYLFSNF